ncbi:LysR substrate-binding domain-containing protein [Halomonas sp. 707D7]|uniref:LysR substrate-binding domain-containing protein n=1 Tax=Halomonas sp. 707D7 TaxID=1681044 RepID=UPI00209EB029|nr:LysR substrate-binding domain-containing protein [Halomonas sp. 707D7]MCP1313274.1 LysR substrate-binding domain-containing protein [Halomonas sp. 707D7]
MFEIKQLGYFVAVAEELNFRRAAKRLHLTQPPLSQAIKQLEAAVGVTLLSRNTHGVQLTRAGEVFLDEARQLLAAAQRSRHRARLAEAGEIGRLRLGYSASALYSSVLTQALATLCRRHPGLDLQLSGGNALDHLHALRAGRLDVALLRADIALDTTPGLRFTRISEEPLFALLHKAHPLAGAERIALADLAGERLLMQPAAGRTFLRRQVEALAERAGVSLVRALELPDISSMIGFAVAGVGVAILPRSAALIAREAVAVALADDDASSPLMLATASDEAAVRALEALIVAAT